MRRVGMESLTLPVPYRCRPVHVFANRHNSLIESGTAFDYGHMSGKRFCVLLLADYRISARGWESPLPYHWKETNSFASQ
jgi:hypothetical protein